ncbi:hypothetical protein APUTEX25_002745, partial [Auxenochlorella protothecoides]
GPFIMPHHELSGWCGKHAGHGILDAGSFDSCYLLTAVGPALLLLATYVKVPYLIGSFAVLTVAWAVILTLLLLSMRWRVQARLKPLAAGVAALYALLAYSAGQYAWHGRGRTPFESRSALAVALGTFLGAAWFASAETRKFVDPAEDEALMESLLGDVEAPVGASTHWTLASKNRKHSWVSLLAIAAKYMWPEDVWLQVRASVCVLLVVAIRLLNLAVPFLYKKVVDEFAAFSARTHAQPPTHYTFWETFYPYVAAYIVVYFFQGGAGGGSVGIISNLRSFLWIPISQNSYRRATLDIFTHVLDMDLTFHLHRKTGELLRIMDRGTNSIQTMLSTVVFSIGPSISDIAAASIYIALSLKFWIAIIVFVTLGGYIPVTIYLTMWRGKFRRELNRLDNAVRAKAADALLNYETVKYFGNEGFERATFARAIDDFQVEDFRLQASLNLVNVAQSFMIFAGLAAGLLVCTQGIADGSLSVGDAVLFVTLMQQLYAPLNFFGTYYRVIQQSMIDMENMFELLAKQPSINDSPGATDLAVTQHDVSFKDVSFEYHAGTRVLSNVSFAIPAGKTVALVGATGSGKSTILRLLFRFYDPSAGGIYVGGKDISHVTQASLRAVIGVVPQDTVLFNDTVRYNIAYARPDASQEDIEAAASAACIDEVIKTKFPMGYDTVVGERGLRLSGGEKQRVAFARAILKNPAILVLDEATSSLDGLTEARIQASLAAQRADRSVLIVAHRLSTVADADAIVVLAEGQVVERGSHAQLLECGGLYARMWRRQAEAAAHGEEEGGAPRSGPVSASTSGEPLSALGNGALPGPPAL